MGAQCRLLPFGRHVLLPYVCVFTRLPSQAGFTPSARTTLSCPRGRRYERKLAEKEAKAAAKKNAKESKAVVSGGGGGEPVAAPKATKKIKRFNNDHTPSLPTKVSILQQKRLHPIIAL